MKLTQAEMTQIKNMLAAQQMAQAVLDDLATKYRERFDAKSDNWKEGDKGTEADTFCTNIENVKEASEALASSFEEIEGIND